MKKWNGTTEPVTVIVAPDPMPPSSWIYFIHEPIHETPTEAGSNAQLFTDALKVMRETGLSSSELVEKWKSNEQLADAWIKEGDLRAKERDQLREENEKLKETIKDLKEAMLKGTELYAHLKFDDQEFTPYQLVLQANQKLKEALKVTDSLAKLLVKSLKLMGEFRVISNPEIESKLLPLGLESEKLSARYSELNIEQLLTK